jgi:hypothetical protein
VLCIKLTGTTSIYDTAHYRYEVIEFSLYLCATLCVFGCIKASSGGSYCAYVDCILAILVCYSYISFLLAAAETAQYDDKALQNLTFLPPFVFHKDLPDLRKFTDIFLSDGDKWSFPFKPGDTGVCLTDTLPISSYMFLFSLPIPQYLSRIFTAVTVTTSRG